MNEKPTLYKIQEIEMQNTTDWSKRYYSDEAKTKIEERKQLWSPELQERVTKDWNQLFADIQASLGEDPAGFVGIHRRRPGSSKGSQCDVRRSRQLAGRAEGALLDSSGDLGVHSEGIRSQQVGGTNAWLDRSALRLRFTARYSGWRRNRQVIDAKK